MPLSGNYVTIDTVLNRLRIHSGSTMDEEDALELVAEVMETVAPNEMLSPMITDGNRNEFHHEPIEVVNYRAKLPCDLVILNKVFELEYFRALRKSVGDSHRVNMSQHPTALDKYKGYTPDFWYFNESKPWADPIREGTYQVKKGYIYTDFPSGHLIVTYQGWPMDEDENLLIPSDAKVIKAMVSTLQHNIDYKLFRSGDIAERVYQISRQDYLYDVPAAGTHAKMPDEDMMYAVSNFMRKTLRRDNYFNTHFTSMGREDRYRTHG